MVGPVEYFIVSLFVTLEVVSLNTFNIFNRRFHYFMPFLHYVPADLGFVLKNESPRDTKKEEETIAETASAVATESPYEEKALIATHDMCHYCFDVIGQELQKRGNTDRKNHKFSHKNTDPINSLVAIDEILPTLDASCPLFVTWDKKVLNKRRPLRTEHTEGEENKHIYELRGCIGTLAPRPLITALREYAILSAFRDGRFEPMRPDEVSSLRVAVSLLVSKSYLQLHHDNPAVLEALNSITLPSSLFFQRYTTFLPSLYAHNLSVFSALYFPSFD